MDDDGEDGFIDDVAMDDGAFYDEPSPPSPLLSSGSDIEANALFTSFDALVLDDRARHSNGADAVLPSDIVLLVLRCLQSATDLLHASGVCVRWRWLVHKYRLWHHFLLSRKRVAHPGAAFVVEFSDAQLRAWHVDGDVLEAYDPVIDDPRLAPSAMNLQVLLHFAFRSRTLVGDAIGDYLLSNAQARGLVAMRRVYLGVGEWASGLVYYARAGDPSLFLIGASRDEVIIRNAGSRPSIQLLGSGEWSACPPVWRNTTAIAEQRMPFVQLRNLSVIPVDDRPDPNTGMSSIFVRNFMHVAMVEVSVRNASGRGVQYNGGCHARVDRCSFIKCLGGVCLVDSFGTVTNCDMNALESDGVDVFCASMGHATVDVSHNRFACNRVAFGVLVRMHRWPHDLLIRIEDNEIFNPLNGIFCKQIESPPTHPATSAPGGGAVGVAGGRVEIMRNTILSPIENGVFVKSPFSPTVNGLSTSIDYNTVSYCRELAIMYTMPETVNSSGIVIGPHNIYEETGDHRPPFPGLRECERDGLCTRNVTGRRAELQRWYVCEQCKLDRANESGVCVACFEEHKDHEGAMLYALLFPGWCGCNSHKAACRKFKSDPPLKE